MGSPMSIVEKKEAKKSKINIKIGGSDGISHYTSIKGAPSSLELKGWEMKFIVQEDGSVSGSNKNEGSSAKKTYSGTFQNGYLNVVSSFSDGIQFNYTGFISLSDANAKLDFMCISGGVGCNVGDRGYSTGKLKVNL